MVRQFHRVIGDEAREQFQALVGDAPDVVVACVGGGSNAIGIFSGFVDLKSRLVGVEPAGGAAVNPGVGNNGANTTFGSLATAFGGGGGGAAHNNTGSPATVRVGKDGASGGGGPAAGTSNTYCFGGGGGGAGGNAVYTGTVLSGTTQDPWNMYDIPGNGIYGGGNGSFGMSRQRNSLIQAGPGVNGYGAGGRGGVQVASIYPGWINGFGATGTVRVSDTTGSTTGAAGTANTGNGGGGSAGLNQSSGTGGAGGSGYARVTFWS
jgi:hypothetical protein